MKATARPIVWLCLRAGAAILLLLTLPFADAALPKSASAVSPTPPLNAASLGGLWAGEGSPWSLISNQRRVIERKSDGRYDAQLTTFENTGEATKSMDTGTWAFRAGLLEVKSDAQVAARVYRVTPESPGCLRLLEVDPTTSRPNAETIAFLECPHPSRLPPAGDFGCAADFSQIGLGGAGDVHVVRLRRTPDGKLQAMLDDAVSNDDVDVWDYPIRTRFRVTDAEGAVANLGESALRHLHQLTKLSKLGMKVTVPFRFSEVRTVRIFEVVPGSRYNEFGGTVLFEVFDAKGRSLARMLRSLHAAPCVPRTASPP